MIGRKKVRQEVIRVTDRVMAKEWDCPICHSRVWFKVVMEEREETGNSLGIKKVVENPFEIRVQTEDDRVIVLRKEKPEMVLTAE